MNGINPYITTLVGPGAMPGIPPVALTNVVATGAQAVSGSLTAVISPMTAPSMDRRLSITAMTPPTSESSMTLLAAPMLAPVAGALLMSGCLNEDAIFLLAGKDYSAGRALVSALLLVGAAVGIFKLIDRLIINFSDRGVNNRIEKALRLFEEGKLDEAEKILPKFSAANPMILWKIPFIRACIQIQKSQGEKEVQLKESIISAAKGDLSLARTCIGSQKEQWSAENCRYLMQLLEAYHCNTSGINLPNDIFGEETGIELAYLWNYAHDLPGKWIDLNEPTDELNTFYKFIANFLGLPMGTDIEVSYAKKVIGKNPVFGPFIKKLEALANHHPIPETAGYYMNAALDALTLPDGKGNLDAARLFRMAMVEYANLGNNDLAEAAALRAHWLERPDRSIDSPVQFLVGRVKITIREVDMRPAKNRELLQKLYVASDLLTERTDNWFEYLELMGIGPAKNEAEYLKNAGRVEGIIGELSSWFASRVGYEGDDPPLFWSKSQIEWKVRRALKDKGVPMTEEFKAELAALAASRPVL